MAQAGVGGKGENDVNTVFLCEILKKNEIKKNSKKTQTVSRLIK